MMIHQHSDNHNNKHITCVRIYSLPKTLIYSLLRIIVGYLSENIVTRWTKAQFFHQSISMVSLVYLLENEYAPKKWMMGSVIYDVIMTSSANYYVIIYKTNLWVRNKLLSVFCHRNICFRGQRIQCNCHFSS